MTQTINTAATNNTGYPISGGIKPTDPGFPAGMNPEIQALKAENASLTRELAIQGAMLTAKIEEVGRLYEIIAILAGKKAQ